MSRISRLRATATPILHRSLMVLCAVVTAVILAIWIRSYVLSERYRSVTLTDTPNLHSARSFGLNSGFGGVELSFFSIATDNREHLQQSLRSWRYIPGYTTSREPIYPPIRGSPDDSVLNTLGIQAFYWHGVNDDGMAGFNARITFPYWLPFLLAAAYPCFCYVRKVIRRQQEDRLAIGLCPRCGEPIDESLPNCRGCDKPVAMLSEA